MARGRKQPTSSNPAISSISPSCPGSATHSPMEKESFLAKVRPLITSRATSTNGMVSAAAMKPDFGTDQISANQLPVRLRR
ncbi:hypothetical protein FQZ97_1162810 [compost metagenome]